MRGVDEESGEFLGPSRSDDRRAALAVLSLATRLVEIPMARLQQMPIDDDMLEHLASAQRITAQIAHKRQVQYVAKKMRNVDPEILESWRALLDFDKADIRREIAESHRIEALREQLIQGKSDLLTPLFEQFPQADIQRIRQLVRNAQMEQKKNKPPHASRELYRVLRELHREQSA